MAEIPTSDYPTIDPTSFDLIVSSTGLSASLLAAAASVAGKSVLHLDSNPFYGSHFSSLPLPSFLSYISSPSSPPNLYSDVEASSQSLPEPSRSYLVDLVGPRLLYCSDETVDLLLRSGASHHVEFKSVDSSLVYWDGKLCSVPDSRQAIFKDKSLGLTEKSQMMKFFKLVQSHISLTRSGTTTESGEEGGVMIPEEDLEMPFVEFLKKQRLPPKIRALVLYAIAMADYEQDNGDSCKIVVSTREGIETISLYTSSIGRFANAVGAFIYPMYGHGELPQAFCRCAAVKGALYVLRMPVIDILTDKESNKYIGVRLASGQEIFSSKLVLDPSYQIPASLSPRETVVSSNLSSYVAKGVCITDRSLEPNSANILLVFPPKSLHQEQSTAVRALQISGNVAVCPSGFFIVHLSTPCEDAALGKEYINSAMKALFNSRELPAESVQAQTKEEGESVEAPTQEEGETKPTLLWSCAFVQELREASYDGAVSICPMPDANLDFRNILSTTRKLFQNMYPGEEFIPQNSAADNIDDDADEGSPE
ncbi:Rab GDP-dissociation inhibitor [Rhynchospora pubera]|uniref:Rab escort protein 1 n=1 Tax=Rhynchospora pubera TaxID=906938 RepID=A0AAV8CB72_9POAL|nr:Rab GDP-dissociation inhibitor [Rhynchospora pubera]